MIHYIVSEGLILTP